MCKGQGCFSGQVVFKSESAAYRLFRDRAQCSDFELSFRVFLVKVAAGSEMVVWFVLSCLFLSFFLSFDSVSGNARAGPCVCRCDNG